MAPRFLAAGDTALTIELGDRAELGLSLHVLGLYRRIAEARLPGVIEVVPTLRSLTVHYDPCETSSAKLQEALQSVVAEAAAGVSDAGEEDLAADLPAGRRWVIPACYEAVHGFDVVHVAQTCGLTPWQVAALHACLSYRVLMIGFLPGHPYMGDLPPPLRIPRRDTPRTAVPPGSIAIATTMSVIYPLESPGGWHVIARTPVKLFDAARSEPSLLAPGDEVRFQPIGTEEFDDVSRRVAEGTWSIMPEAVGP